MADAGPVGAMAAAGAGVLAPGGLVRLTADGLTQREVEVLAEIAAGLSNAEIAAKFRISDATVKTHVNHLLAKTGMRDRAQLVAYAFRRGPGALSAGRAHCGGLPRRRAW